MNRTGQPDFAQDPGELFDILDGEGNPLGIALPRAQVHQEGHWHRALHLWVYGENPPQLLFQRRSLAKDTWPGRFDATVGGHFRAGEGLEETLREASEEIGIDVALTDLRFVGCRPRSSESEPGVIDREIQEIYLWRCDDPLAGLQPNPAELSEVVSLPLFGLLELFRTGNGTLTGEALSAEGVRHSTIATLDDFIPTIDRYSYRVAIAVEGAIAGREHFAV